MRRLATASLLAGLLVRIFVGFFGGFFGASRVAHAEVVAEAPAPAAASVPAAAPVPVEDPLSIYVLTFGPGDHPFFMFGHDAVLVRDRAARTDKVYNFGTFRFDSPQLIVEFLKGRLTYWLSVSPLPFVLESYAAENRSVAVQELVLPPDEKRTLRDRLDENALPRNRPTSTTTSSTTARRACAT